MPYLDFANLLSCFQITTVLKIIQHILFLAEYLPVWQQQNQQQTGKGRFDYRKENFLSSLEIKIFQETLTHPVPDSCLVILCLSGGRVKKFPSETTEIANSVFSILIQCIQLYIHTLDEWKQSRLTTNTVEMEYFCHQKPRLSLLWYI